jgi:uncharacterized protein YdhG (YjbR/CyaY superfamily)
MSKPTPKTIDEYIAAAPKEAQAKLQELREILKAAAPSAKENIKWGQPVLETNRILFSFSAYTSHLNFMPTRSTLEHFTEELAEYNTGKDTIQFSYDKPLPIALIKKIAAFRVAEVSEGSLWKHHT